MKPSDNYDSRDSVTPFLGSIDSFSDFKDAINARSYRHELILTVADVEHSGFSL